MGRELLIASGNPGKIKEICAYLQDLELDIKGLNDYHISSDVVEDGNTFQDNALKKARTRANETGVLTLADDSGLEVDCLNGRPGIYSARYSGPEASDEDNNRKLVEEIKRFPPEQCTARYRIVIALVDPELEEEITVDGTCEGRIITTPRGDKGFGYDPFFFLPEYGKTMAELPLSIKNRISHRANALKKVRELLIDRYQ